MIRTRLKQRFDLVSGGHAQPLQGVAGPGWSKQSDEVRGFLSQFIELGAPEIGDFDFEWQRRRLEQTWCFDQPSGFWRHERLRNKRSYRVPDQFCGLIKGRSPLTFAL